MNKYLKALIKYSAGLIVATGIFFLVVSSRNIFALDDKQQIYRFLSDGFVIPGAIFLGVGLLLFIANLGALDGISYVLKHAVLMLVPFLKKKHQTYKEFVENRKGVHGYSFIFVIGGVFVVLAIVFAILFSTL